MDAIHSNQTTWDPDWIAQRSTTFLKRITKGTPLETPAKLIWCYHNNIQCALDAASYLAYDVPKSTAKGIGYGAFCISRWLLEEGAQRIGPQGDVVKDLVSKRYHYAADKINALVQNATILAAPNATKILDENLLLAASTHTTPPEPFSVVDLIGPTLFMGYCASKAVKYAKKVAHSTYLILSGVRDVTTTYTATPRNWKMSADGKVDLNWIENYETEQIIIDFFVEGFFTAVWGGGAYFSYQGIKEALINAGSDSARAVMITNSLFTAMTVAPTLYAIVKRALENAPTLVGPKYAPDYAYSVEDQDEQEERQDEIDTSGLDINKLFDELSALSAKKGTI